MRLRGAYLAMHRAFQAFFVPFGVTADQFVALSLLAEEDGAIQRDLAQRSHSDANTVAALLRLLEQKGLVRRERDREDARALRVFLTPKGRALQMELARESEAMHARLIGSVPEAEREGFLRLLERVSAAFPSRTGVPGEEPQREEEP
jgi:DNA-binding MarR family transcriptional regulator